MYGRADPNCLRRSSPCLLRLKNNISPSTSCNFLGLMGEDAQPRERRPCRQSLASRLTWSIACKVLQIVKTSTQRHPARGRWPRLEPYPVLVLGLRRGLTRGFPHCCSRSLGYLCLTGRSFVTWERCILSNLPILCSFIRNWGW